MISVIEKYPTRIGLRAFLTCFFAWVGSISLLIGQLPPLQPEQDCPAAIPVCQSVYVQNNAYIGAGNLPHEINPYQSCLLSGEQNDVWYRFTVQSGGNLCFSIIPMDSLDDYDWALFDLSQSDCNDIYRDPTLELSCNFYTATPACGGITGANGLLSSPCPGPNESCIPVSQGQTLLLNVSNFSASNQGYILDFSASTADIYDEKGPEIKGLQIDCGGQMLLEFNEAIELSSFQVSDLELRDSSGRNVSLSSLTPIRQDSSLSYAASFILESRDSLGGGNYQISIVDSLWDLCLQPVSLFQARAFHFPDRTLHVQRSRDIICPGDTLTLRAVGTGEALWNNIFIGDSFSLQVFDPQWIRLTMSFPDGCQRKDSILVAAQIPESPQIPEEVKLCLDDSLPLPLPKDSLSRFTWWERGLPLRDTLWSPTAPGIFTLEVERQIHGCKGIRDSFEIRVNPPPPLHLAHEGSPCPKDAWVQVNALTENITQAQWSLNGLPSPIEGLHFTPFLDGPGMYEIEILVMDSLGCTRSESLNWEVIDSPKLAEKKFEICQGDSLLLNVGEFSKEGNPSDYGWFMNGRVISDSIFNINLLESGLYGVGIWVEDSMGCRDTAIQQVNVLPLPPTSFKISDSCEASPLVFTLEDSENKAYWLIDGQYSGYGKTWELPPILAPGRHVLELEIINGEGCTRTDFSEITIHPRPVLSWEGRDSLCFGEDFELKLSGASSYRWSSSLGEVIHTEDHWIFPGVEQDFLLSVIPISEVGCDGGLLEIPVHVLEPGEVSRTIDRLEGRYAHQMIRVQASGAWEGLRHEWIWGDGEVSWGEEAVKSYESEGNYPLLHRVHWKDNCSFDAWKGRAEIARRPGPEIPTAFSPNGDGINDTWMVHGMPGQGVHFKIFDRWGKIIWRSKGNNISWNGIGQGGMPCAEGTYVYQMEYIDAKGRPRAINGSISLLR